MADIQINVDAGSQTRLLTAGTYCADDILVTSESGDGNTEFEDELLSGGLTEYRNDRVTELRPYALRNYSTIVSLKLASVITANTNSLSGMTSLVNLQLPLLQTLSGDGAQNMASIESLYFPSIIDIGTFAFLSAKKLVKVALGKNIASIAQGAFNNCMSFSVLIILNQNKVCSLTGSIGSDTPIVRGTGQIYVPDDLVDQYKVSTNWAIYAAQIKGLSEIPDDVREWLNQQQGGVSA